MGHHRQKVGIAGASIVALAVAVTGRVAHDLLKRPVCNNAATCDLVEAVGPRRFVRARLCGGFAFGPFVPARAPAESGVTSTDGRFLTAAGEVRQRAVRNPTRENRQALAVAHLLAGASQQAVEMLERLALEYPRDARVHSDLSAAYLARADSDERASDRPRSLEHALMAIELEPELPEALTNAAIGMEALNLPKAAHEAWAALREREPSSPWLPASPWLAEGRRPVTLPETSVADAIRHRDHTALSAILLDRSAAVRDFYDFDLLGSEDGDQEGRLRDAQFVADLYARVTGDEHLQQDVEAAGRAELALREEWLHAHREYARARRAYDARVGNYGWADSAFAHAGRSFAHVGSSYALWCRFHQAVFLYWSGSLARAAERFQALRAPALEAAPSLAARVEWMVGLIASERGAIDASLAAYGHSARLFRRVGDAAGDLGVRVLLADRLGEIGRNDDAWREYGAATERAWGPRVSTPEPAALRTGSRAARRQGLLRVARTFGALMAKTTGVGGDDLRVWEYADLADIAHRLGDPIARLHLSRARSDLASAPAERAALKRQELWDKWPDLPGLVDPLVFENELSEAIAHYRGQGQLARLPRLYAARARSLMSRGRDHEAARDLEAAIGSIRTVTVSEHRSFSTASREQEWGTVDDLVQVSLRLGEEPTAVLARVAAIREQIPVDIDPHQRLRERQRQLGPREAIVVFLSLSEQLLAWVVTPAEVRLVRIPISSSQLALAVERLVSEIRSGEDEGWRRTAEDLFELVWRPVAAILSEADQVWVVPDGALGRLPFGALYDGSAGKHLLDQQRVGLAHSLKLRWPSLAMEPAVSVRRAAVWVGRSSQNPLPRATEEGAQVGKLYPGAALLDGSSASRERLLNQLDDADLLHFAGHAVNNPFRPELSHLILRDGEDPLSLYVADLESWQPRRLRMVVLSACDTVGASQSRVTFAGGIAAAFLDRGVPVVVGTLWDVDDARTATLMEAFHRKVRVGSGVLDAAREAQLEMARSLGWSAPQAWAGLVVVV